MTDLLPPGWVVLYPHPTMNRLASSQTKLAPNTDRRTPVVRMAAPVPTIQEVLSFKHVEEPEVPELVLVDAHRKVGEAIDLSQRYGISQIPVVRNVPAQSLALLRYARAAVPKSIVKAVAR